MAYYNENTIKTILINEIDNLSEMLGVTVQYDYEMEHLTYSALVELRDELKTKLVNQDNEIEVQMRE